MPLYPLEAGVSGIRAEVIDKAVKQVAKRAYKFKQAVAIQSTSSWTNTFFREDLSVLDAAGSNAISNIPRGANFPQARPDWQEVSVKIVKFGLEENIPWEDILSDNIDVQGRSIIRVTEGVVKKVDDHIFSELLQNEGTDTSIVIQSFAIGTTAHGGHWDESSAAVIDNFMHASELISTNGNYDVSNLICFVSPRDKRSIMKYLADKGTQWSPIATDIATNGRIGKVAGIDLVESNSVTASWAVVVKPKTCATWKELVSLRSTSIVDPYRSTMIRVVEEGALELTDPKAVVWMKGTQSASA